MTCLLQCFFPKKNEYEEFEKLFKTIKKIIKRCTPVDPMMQNFVVKKQRSKQRNKTTLTNNKNKIQKCTKTNRNITKKNLGIYIYKNKNI